MMIWELENSEDVYLKISSNCISITPQFAYQHFIEMPQSNFPTCWPFQTLCPYPDFSPWC